MKKPMRIPRFLRGWDNDPDHLDFGACFVAAGALTLGLTIAVFFLFILTYFATTTFTGPCRGAGGVGSYSVDYVQCGNGKRVIYERTTVESQRYGLRVEDGPRK